MTREALEVARRLEAATLEPAAAQADLVALAKLASRLGARIDLEELRSPIHAAIRGRFEKALTDGPESVQQVVDLLDLARRLDLHLDLWQLQNALWEAVRTGSADRAVAGRLAGPLWFDEAALLARLDGLPRRASA
jgi:hypothetical protein